MAASSQFMARLGPVCVANGYPIIPIIPHQKNPALGGWLDIVATPELVTQWIGQGFNNHGIGILTGGRVAFIDIDVLDMQMAELVVARLRQEHPGVLVRYGMRPKVGVLFRCGEPFTKLMSRTFVDPQGRTAKIEILGTGQQFVAYGVHPDTKADYEWLDGRSPATTPLAELPLLTAEAKGIIKRFETSCEHLSWPPYVRPRQYRNGGGGGPGTGNGHADPDDPFSLGADELRRDRTRLGLAEAEIRMWVMLIPNTPDKTPFKTRDDWVTVAFAIYHETQGNEFGRQLFYEWSAQYDNNPAEWEKVWNSSKAELARRPITFRWIITTATPFREPTAADFITALGVAPTRTAIDDICDKIRKIRFDPVTFDQICAALKAALTRLSGPGIKIATIRRMVWCSIAPAGMDGWRYLTLDREFYQVATTARYKVDSFNAIWAPTFVDIPASQIAFVNKWLGMTHSIMYLPHITADTYTDSNDLVWRNCYNKRSVPAIPTTVSDRDRVNVRLIREHFDHLFEPRDAAMLKSHLGWIARTNRRINWMPIIQGAENIGKTFILRLYQTVLGITNVGLLTTGTLVDSIFSDWLESKQVMIVEELRQANHRWSIAERLKPLIGSDYVECHPKNRPPRTIINCMSILAFTNYDDAIPVDVTNTRFYVARAKLQRPDQVEEFNAEHPDYFKRLFAVLDESPGALRRAFLDFPLHADFNAVTRAPKSEGFRDMVEATRNPLAQRLLDIIETGKRRDLSEHTVLVSSAVTYLQQWSTTPLREEQIPGIARSIGLSRLARLRLNGNFETVWTRVNWPTDATERNLRINDWLTPYFDSDDPMS